MGEKHLAIIQSNYIPWKGYFDILGLVDEFILYDDMQYTRRDWRNRNKIKTPRGLQWITIPVQVKGKYFQTIRETQVTSSAWADEHWKSLHHNYGKAPYFEQYAPLFDDLYRQAAAEPYLSQINYLFITAICDLLGIDTRITWSMDYEIPEGKTERLIGLCQQVEATSYLSGPSARGYIDEQLFVDAGIDLVFMDYSDYPEYEQFYPPFEHGVTILDLIFHTGPDAPRYMKSLSK
jgi:hypothetical protein